MADPRDEINRIIESAERESYARGWRDAITAVAESANQMKMPEPTVVAIAAGTEDAASGEPPAQVIQPRRSGRPSSPAIQIVAQCVAATPGMKGVEIVKAAQTINNSIRERTVRTCLRRLRITKVIWKRNGLWYPKPRETLFENAIGEVTVSPPH